MKKVMACRESQLQEVRGEVFEFFRDILGGELGREGKAIAKRAPF